MKDQCLLVDERRCQRKMTSDPEFKASDSSTRAFLEVDIISSGDDVMRSRVDIFDSG